MTVAEAIRPALDDAVAPLGMAIDEVNVTMAGRRRVVKVTVERLIPSHGDLTEQVEPVSLDDVAEATRAVSDALDTHGGLGEQPYTLEVSSPGISQPLRHARAFRRNVGRLISIDRGAGNPPVCGRIIRAGESEMTLTVAATKKVAAHDIDITYHDAEGAKVQVEFSRPSPDSPPETTDH